jgi:hypothetical protein
MGFRARPLRLYVTGATLAALSLWLGGCATVRPAPHAEAAVADIPGPGRAEEPGRDPSLRFQIIYVIHGDGGYVWYDDAGARHEADQDAVAQARGVAENSPTAEVFIFHQRPTRFLRFFHGSDGTLWQYRKGRLVRQVPYDRSRAYAPSGRAEASARSGDGLGAEADLFSRFASLAAPRRCGAPAQDPPVRIFCYFGHGIPVTGKVPYFRSRPDVAVSLASFTRGLVRFGGPACPPSKPFSLVVLSACHGGTPEATLALAPYADWILASPGELHLSYLDTRALARMAKDNPDPFGKEQAGAWARAIATESFARLGESVRTGVTLSLYDAAQAETYLRGHRGAWAETAEAIAAESATDESATEKSVTDDSTVTGPLLFSEPTAYRDCAENPAFGDGGVSAGATIFYQPPRFGADRNKTGHSGWECPALEPRRASLP